MITSPVPVRVPAGGYAVLARNWDKGTNGNVTAIYQWASYQLGNSGDEIYIAGHGGTEIDHVEYPSGFGVDGKTKELSRNRLTYLLNDNTVSGSPTNYWCDATVLFSTANYGTPGAQNSCTK